MIMSNNPIKHVKVEYIESGTFQGGEEDVSKAGIEYGEDCIVISKSTFKNLKKSQVNYEKIKGFIVDDSTGDIDFIKFQIKNLEKSK